MFSVFVFRRQRHSAKKSPRRTGGWHVEGDTRTTLQSYPPPTSESRRVRMSAGGVRRMSELDHAGPANAADAPNGFLLVRFQRGACVRSRYATRLSFREVLPSSCEEKKNSSLWWRPPRLKPLAVGSIDRQRRSPNRSFPGNGLVVDPAIAATSRSTMSERKNQNAGKASVDA